MNNGTLETPGTEAPPVTAWRAYQGISPSAVDEKELVERYLPLVRNVVDRLKITLPVHVAAEDLYSIGVTGLMTAVRRYDPNKCDTFARYATTRIRGAILDELRRMDWCSRDARGRARKIKQAVATLHPRLGRPPTPAEVRDHLGLSQREYDRWVEDAQPATFVAIDDEAAAAGTAGATSHDRLPDESVPSGREVTENAELLQVLGETIAALPETPRKVLALYYFEGLRLAEIAAVFGLTESRICQIHSQAILLLRGRMAHLQYSPARC